ncbi:MAG: response regulator receiver [Planctomycetaceae bacterium]|nr:response regulator receiver [Planctomycetaceae bacterium]
MARILVVDDSPVDGRLAGRLLEKGLEAEVAYAENGKVALEQIARRMPDLVLTDMQMPELDGLQLVEALKKQYPALPVILMTAAGSEEVAVQALALGASSYVPKRLLAKELVEVAERMLTMSREQQAQYSVLDRQQRWEADFVLENNLELILSLSELLKNSFRQMKICDPSEALRVGISLEEALLNAYYHGNLEVSSKLREEDFQSYYDLAAARTKMSPYRERRIYVTAKLTPEEGTFVIRDDGPGFDPSSLPDPTDPEYLERPHGRGLMLMRTFMNEICYNAKGNEVRLVKRPGSVELSE